MLIGVGSDCRRPSSAKRARKYTASLVASEAATISASHEDSATVGCFFEDQEMAARPCMKTQPDVEWRVAQSESEWPCTAASGHTS
eukprot:913515-Pleurochrysis_carterae.AAC.1